MIIQNWTFSNIPLLCDKGCSSFWSYRMRDMPKNHIWTHGIGRGVQTTFTWWNIQLNSIGVFTYYVVLVKCSSIIMNKYKSLSVDVSRLFYLSLQRCLCSDLWLYSSMTTEIKRKVNNVNTYDNHDLIAEIGKEYKRKLLLDGHCSRRGCLTLLGKGNFDAAAKKNMIIW